MADSEDKQKEPKPLEFSQITYQRAPWKHVYRWIIFIFLIGLDIAMPVSSLVHLAHSAKFNPLFELGQLLFLIVINAWYLPVCLFEINYAIVRPEELEVGNLIWTAKLTRGKIVSLTTPRFLAGALLRTASCFYLINRSDIKNCDELLTIISQRYL